MQTYTSVISNALYEIVDAPYTTFIQLNLYLHTTEIFAQIIDERAAVRIAINTTAA